MTRGTGQVWMWIHCLKWVILGFASLGHTLPTNLTSACNHHHLVHLSIFDRTIGKRWASKDTFPQTVTILEITWRGGLHSLEEAGADDNSSYRGQTCRTMGLGDVGSESPGERAKEQYTENPPGRTQDPGATAGQAGGAGTSRRGMMAHH